MAVGYGVWSVAKGHRDSLVAHRENRLMLCLLDLPVSLFIKKAMIDQALDFIDEMRADGQKVMVHCVQGMSRSPSITLLYLPTRLHVLPADSFEAAENAFSQIYPRYRPSTV